MSDQKGRLIATNSERFIQERKSAMGEGWRIEWNGDGWACYDPLGEEQFIYGTTPEEEAGAWTYLTYHLFGA